MTHTILCFGDSNTHGYIPKTAKRYAFDVRWTGVLQKALGQTCHVIEAGLNGRSAVHDEPLREGRNGSHYLSVILESHVPINTLIIMLGTNDVLNNKGVTALDAANGVSTLIDISRETFDRLGYQQPTILIISPPIALTPHEIIDSESVGNPIHTHHFSKPYKDLAETKNCMYLDAAAIVTTSELDGAHLDEANHHKLGLAIANTLKEII